MFNAISRRDFMKGVMIGGVAAGSAGLLAACGSSSSSSTSESSSADTQEESSSETETSSSEATEEVTETSTGSHDVIIGIPATPESLSPFVSASTGRLHLLPICYESLGYFTDSTYSEFKPILMESYEMSDDALTYTIYLHDNIYDTAGNHMTASDVIFSWDKGIELGANTWGRYVDEYYAADDYTIVLKLAVARSTAFTDICRGAVVTQAAYEASEDEMASIPVSTSHYQMTDYVTGSTYVFERNEDYWNDDESTWAWKANPDTVTYSVILEESQMAIALETGAVDVALGMSNNNTDRYAGDDNYNMFELIGNMCYTMIFNCSENSVFCNNQALRQAAAYAVDADGIIEAVMGGAAIRLGTYGFCLAADYKDEWADSYYVYDVDKAKELLAEAGYGEGELEIKLAVSSGSVLEKTAEMIQLYLLDAGFKTVEINSVDTALFSTLKTDNTEWDILLDTKGSQTVAGNASNFDRTQATYGNICFANDDDTLQYYAELLPTTLGGTEENVDEYVAYINDMCYVYALYNTASYTVTSSNITYVLQDFRSAVIPGEIEFAN